MLVTEELESFRGSAGLDPACSTLEARSVACTLIPVPPAVPSFIIQDSQCLGHREAQSA